MHDDQAPAGVTILVGPTRSCFAWWARTVGASYLIPMVVDPRIESYIASLDGKHEPVLAAMEAFAERRGFPIVGPRTGALLFMLAQVVGARRILELGSGYGYSAVWFARAVPAGGRVVCTDLSPENRELALGYFRTAGLMEKIDFQVGDALAFARKLEGPFDIVFNDVDKEQYPTTVELAARLLRPGGLFITDNALWSGRVADPENREASTEGVRRFNSLIFSRADLESIVIPIGDGVAVCRKR
jgi:caffeoyl-CoA O-methyltransferase